MSHWYYVDFSMASIGDYIAREIADIIDPNVKKSWMKDGRIDGGAALTSLRKSA